MNVKILYQGKKSMEPETIRENIISIQGHITGLKKEISVIKNNHLKHLHDDVMEIHKKLDSNIFSINTKLDRYLIAFVGFLVSMILLLLGAIVKHFLS